MICKKLDEKVIDLFIFRNLDDWLKSFCTGPNELKKKWNNFETFLNIKQSPIGYWLNNNKEILNKDDNGKTIFEIRYYKFNKIMEYKNSNKNLIFINLKFIQDENNLSKFLDFLSDKYIPKLKNNNYILSITGERMTRGILDNKKNRKIPIDIDKYRDIINSNKNEEIEKFIDSLTFISY